MTQPENTCRIDAFATVAGERAGAKDPCLSLRGVEKLGAAATTSALRCLVREDPRTRRELLAPATTSRP